MKSTAMQKKRFLLASIIPRDTSDIEAYQDMKELKELVDAYGGHVIEFVVQRREVHDKGQYLGRGKLEEIGDAIKKEKIDIVVLNAAVKPGQLFDMRRSLERYNPKIKLWDRVDLILEIFSNHAHTTEARLQIDLAAMRHMGPRIYGMGYELSRQGGSIGTRGIGETNTELMKRHWRSQIKKSADKLKKLEEDRERQLMRRRKMGLPTISIVGYTNAGKTSLFNLLAHKKNLVENALFATLDAGVGKVILPHSKQPILISDTIGFIRNLPTSLIDAFTSTLMESLHADVLLHIIDSSDPDIERKIQAVKTVLRGMNVSHKKTLYIFNKCDRLSPEQITTLESQYHTFTPLFISSKTSQGIDHLLTQIEASLSSNPSPHASY